MSELTKSNIEEQIVLVSTTDMILIQSNRLQQCHQLESGMDIEKKPV
jgi:hypothetical protein